MQAFVRDNNVEQALRVLKKANYGGSIPAPRKKPTDAHGKAKAAERVRKY